MLKTNIVLGQGVPEYAAKQYASKTNAHLPNGALSSLGLSSDNNDPSIWGNIDVMCPNWLKRRIRENSDLQK